jgi:hypothetical protein
MLNPMKRQMAMNAKHALKPPSDAMVCSCDTSSTLDCESNMRNGFLQLCTIALKVSSQRQTKAQPYDAAGGAATAGSLPKGCSSSRASSGPPSAGASSRPPSAAGVCAQGLGRLVPLRLLAEALACKSDNSSESCHG